MGNLDTSKVFSLEQSPAESHPYGMKDFRGDEETVLTGSDKLRVHLRSTLPIFLSGFSWYISSLAITVLNKYLFDTAGFKFPVIVTFINFIAVSLVISVLFFFFSKSLARAPVRILLSNVSWSKIIPSSIILFIFFLGVIKSELLHPLVAVLGAMDITLANLSYSEVSLSVVTVMRSSSIIVIYFFSVIMKIERFSMKLFSIVCIIFLSISVTITSIEVKNRIGIVFLIGSVLAGGLRWVLIHEQFHITAHSPLELMFLTQPIAAAALAIPAFYLEYDRLVLYFLDTSTNTHGGLMIITIIFFIMLSGFMIMISEYYFVSLTSSLSLTVAGIGKEVATIFLSAILFSETLDDKTLFGVVVSLMAISVYSYYRYKETKNAPHMSLSLAPVISCQHEYMLSCSHQELSWPDHDIQHI